MTENQGVKLLWDFEIQTDRSIEARRPDIVLEQKSKRKVLIIDIAVPEDRNMHDKVK